LWKNRIILLTYEMGDSDIAVMVTMHITSAPVVTL
jgi:hypothetical protein